VIFHPSCLTCDSCQAQLPDAFHKDPNGRRLCPKCIPSLRSPCTRCGRNIDGDFRQVKSGFYHPDCFRCDICKVLLKTSFHEYNGQNLCDGCVPKGGRGKKPGKSFSPRGRVTGRQNHSPGVSFSPDIPDDAASGDARRIWGLIDSESMGEVSKLQFLEAIRDKPQVSEFVSPVLDGSDVFTDEDAFDIALESFDRIADGKCRLRLKDFATYFGAAAMKYRRKTAVLVGHRTRKRVFIIGPGFGQQMNPRQGRSVEQAGFQVHWYHGVPNPEFQGFPVKKFLPLLKAEIDGVQPDVLLCGSKGALYATALWQAGLWSGPTVMLNAHPSCVRLPPNMTVVICHGANDEVYQRSRAELEQLMQTGMPNRTLLYYTGNSGPMPCGRLTRVGDMHNMESLLHYGTLPRLVDSALSPAGPEMCLLESWRDRITDQRLVGEQHLGLTPELLKRFWVSNGQKGLDDRKLFEVPRDSPEFEQVIAIFKSQPREPPMYCGQDPGMWYSSLVLRVERVENGNQLDGNAKPNCEVLRTSLEEQGLSFEPSVHTRWAFHGTDAIDSVVNNPMQGFQPLASGSRGSSVWGLGTYFARDAKYVSDGGFCPPGRAGTQQMLMCLLMTGMPCLGDPGHKGVLPFRQRPHRYNSSVDSLSNPEIFIIQHPGAAYPAYLITFQRAN